MRVLIQLTFHSLTNFWDFWAVSSHSSFLKYTAEVIFRVRIVNKIQVTFLAAVSLYFFFTHNLFHFSFTHNSLHFSFTDNQLLFWFSSDFQLNFSRWCFLYILVKLFYFLICIMQFNYILASVCSWYSLCCL